MKQEIAQTSRALALPSEEKIKELDELAHKYGGLLATNETPFHASLHLALAMNQLRSKLTAEVMEPMMALMNTPLGFLTDRTGKPNARGETKPLYDVTIVRDCLIEGLLRGFMPVNNEINIIASRCYPAKNGLSRKVKQYPGLTEYKDSFTVPRISEGKGAVIACRASWKLNGKEDQIEREFAIKGDAYATADSYLGKAQRKLYHAVFERVTGQSLPEGEVTDDELAYAKDVTPAPERKSSKPNFSRQQEGNEKTRSAQDSRSEEEPQPAPTASAELPAEAPIDAPPAFKEPENLQQKLALLLHEKGQKQPRFLNGLRLIGFPGVPDDADTVHALSDETCTAILNENFGTLISKVIDAEWLKDEA